MAASSSSSSSLADVQAQLRAERRRIEAELGIPAQQRDFASVAASAKGAAKRKRGAGAPLPPEEPLRRSSRATRQAAVFAPTGLAGDGDLAAALGGGGGSSSATAASAPAGPSRVDPVTGQLRPEAPADPGSLRSFRARLDYMTQTYLGKHVPVALAGGGNQAKAAVLWEACARSEAAASSSSSAAASPGPRPRFNKYAGLQQYADAAVLFANIASDEDGSGGAFGNAFGDGGRTITWFASASQHEQTPAILRLRHHATGHTYVPDTGGGDDGEPVTLAPCGVALVCRLPGQPHVWCGQLELVAMDEGSRPLQFTWRLTHADALRQAPAFRALLEAQGVKL